MNTLREKGNGKKEKGGNVFIKKILPVTLFLLPFSLVLSSCKSPFDRTKDPSNGGALGSFNTAGHLVVFSNELKTGGGAFLFPSGENQTLAFNDTSNSISARSIRYFWNGESVGGQVAFAGFDLMHVASEANYASTPGRNLSAAGYTNVTFWVRGTVAVNSFLKVEVADDGNSATPAPCIALSPDGTVDAVSPATPCGTKGVLSTTWTEVRIPISNSNLIGLKDFFKGTIVFNTAGSIPGGGGTVYFDEIQYNP